MNDRILSLLGLCRRAGKLVIGADPCIDSMAKSKAKLILYANDFSQNSLKPVLLQAHKQTHKQNVRVLEVNRTKDEISFSLGKLCGVLSVEDKGFADKLAMLIEGEQRGE